MKTMNPDWLLSHFNEISEAPDAVPRLRRFILDLAVRGKLIRQDPKDEPASELLKRIQEEKARLVKEGKIRKQDQQAEIDATGIPFALPERWAWARLGDVIHLVSGQHLQPSEYSDQQQGGPPYITGPADFGRNGLVITRYAVVRKAVANKGQILLTVKGAGVGKTTLCDLPEVAISRQLMAMTPIEWSQPYLLLTTHRLAEALKESARSLIPGISREDVDQFVFPLPPLAEQHRIVAKVDELMALCDELEAAQQKRERRRDRLVAATLNGLDMDGLGRDVSPKRPHSGGRDGSPSRPNIPQLKTGGFGETALPKFFLTHFPRLTTRPEHIQQLRQTILTLAVCGKLVPQDPNDEPATDLLKRIEAEKARLVNVGEIRNEKPLPVIDEEAILFNLPASWKWVPIRKITTDRGQKVPDKKFSYIDVSAIDKERGKIAEPQVLTPDAAPSRARKIVQKGDVIYSCVRPYLLNIAVVEEEFRPEPIVSTAFAVLNGLGFVLPHYLWIVLRSSYFVGCVEEKMRGQAYPAINDGAFAPLPVPLAPLLEQHRIVAKVDELMGLCDELESRLSSTTVTRRQLLEATLSEAIAPS